MEGKNISSCNSIIREQLIQSFKTDKAGNSISLRTRIVSKHSRGTFVIRYWGSELEHHNALVTSEPQPSSPTLLGESGDSMASWEMALSCAAQRLRTEAESVCALTLHCEHQCQHCSSQWTGPCPLPSIKGVCRSRVCVVQGELPWRNRVPMCSLGRWAASAEYHAYETSRTSYWRGEATVARVGIRLKGAWGWETDL